MVRCLSPSLPVPAVSVATELMCEKQNVFIHVSSSAWLSFSSGHRPAQSNDHGGWPTPARGQIEECGAHFVVENLEDVRCEEVKTDEGTRLMFTAKLARALTEVRVMW